MSCASKGCDRCDLFFETLGLRQRWVLLRECHWWAPTLPNTRLSRPLRLGSSLQTLWFSLWAIFSLVSSSAGVAPLPPGFHKLLTVTFTTFAVFPSWLNLLGGDDDCMLSVPSGACELHISCWQGSDSCQAIAAAALTLFNYALWFLRKADDPFFLFCLAVLPTCYLLHDSRHLGLTLRPSAPVCCCHRVSWTRGRLAFAQEAVRCPLFFLHSVLVVVLGSGRRLPVSNFTSSGAEMWRFCNCVKLFWDLHIPCVCTVLDHLFGMRLGALEMCHVLVHRELPTVVDHDSTNCTIDEVFSDWVLPTPPGPTPLWGPGSIPNNWADFCGFLKHPGSQRFWILSKHGAFSIPGLCSSDQSCHHETWLHLHFVDWSNQWKYQAHYKGNIRPKERPASSGNIAPKRSISEVLRNHSLSSWLRNHLRSWFLRFPLLTITKWPDELWYLYHLECFSCDLLIIILMCT